MTQLTSKIHMRQKQNILINLKKILPPAMVLAAAISFGGGAVAAENDEKTSKPPVAPEVSSRQMPQRPIRENDKSLNGERPPDAMAIVRKARAIKETPAEERMRREKESRETSLESEMREFRELSEYVNNPPKSKRDQAIEKLKKSRINGSRWSDEFYKMGSVHLKIVIRKSNIGVLNLGKM